MLLTATFVLSLVPSSAAASPAVCAGPAPARQAPVQGNEEAPAFGHTQTVSAEDELRSYRWDDGPEIPAPSGSGAMRLPFGEAGAAPSTLVYAPFHAAGDGEPAFVGSLDGAFRRAGGAWGAGRLGGGLQLTNDASLTIEPREGDLVDAAWTLSFWVWLPKPPAVISVARAPGVFDMTVGPKGVCRVNLETDPAFTLWGKAELTMGAWNHLALAVNGPELRQVRLSVNGTPNGRFIESCPPVPSIRIGGFEGILDELRLDARAETSAELMERADLTVPPGERLLTLRYADRVETVRTWAGALREPVLAGDAWAQGQAEHAELRDGALRWLPGDWRRYPSGDGPIPRTTHPTVYVGDHRVLIFGGETRDSHVGGMVNTDDTWIFHADTGAWVRSRSEDAPPPSCHQSAAYSPDHGVVLYAGGQYNQGDDLLQYDETWLYHVEEDRWEQREPQGDRPPIHSDGAIVYHPKLRRFLLYAGGAVLYLYDPEADTWERLRAGSLGLDDQPVPYVPGGSPMMGYDPDGDRFAVYGGAVSREGRTHWQDDTAFLTLEPTGVDQPPVGVYRVLEPEFAPPGRVRAGFAYDERRKRFVLFGGVLDQRSRRMEDLWAFRPDVAEWTRMDAANTPPRRGGFYHMAYDPELDRFLLLCGRHSHLIFSNDAWSLHLDEAATGRAAYTFDRTAFPDLDGWFAEWREPDGAQVTFRFRGSNDGLAWSPWAESVGAAAGADARFVQVEIELRAGGLGAVPEVLRMGFHADGDANAAEADGRFLAERVAPFSG